MKQKTLIPIEKKRRKPDEDNGNRIVRGVQKFKTSDGCPHLCPFCYEHDQLKVFEIPEITSKVVEILDMNFLWQPNIIERIRELQSKRLKGGTYEAISGFDFRLITKEIVEELKKTKFINIRIAWDLGIKYQYKIKDVINLFLKAGYKSENIGVFMLANWKITKNICDLKLDLLKTWNVRVCDCCYDGGYKYAIPEDWSKKEIDEFRARCALHNQTIGFKIYPDLKRAERFIKKFKQKR